jgi:hypothetical protein
MDGSSWEPSICRTLAIDNGASNSLISRVIGVLGHFSRKKPSVLLQSVIESFVALENLVPEPVRLDRSFTHAAQIARVRV